MQTEYHRVYELLLEQIRSGEYPENSKLPTERELCDQYQVSRITIRQALQKLEDKKLIKRQQGRGTFVNTKHIDQKLSTLYSFSEELRKQNITPGTRMLFMLSISAQGNLQKTLGVPAGTPLYSICRLRLADETPYAYETSYIPMVYLMDATPEEITKNGLYNTVKRCSGITIEKATEIFEAILAPQHIVETLGRKGVLSAMQIFRTAYYHNTPIEYCESIVCGDKFRFHVTLT